jgi:hypothetical protein
MLPPADIHSGPFQFSHHRVFPAMNHFCRSKQHFSIFFKQKKMVTNNAITTGPQPPQLKKMYLL